MPDSAEGRLPLSAAERARLTIALAAGRAGTKLEAVLIADQDGNTLLEAAEETPNAPEIASALRALALRIAAQAPKLAQNADHETHFFDWEGRQVIGKQFKAGSQDWLLVALCLPKASYKQAVTRLIKSIEIALRDDGNQSKVKRTPRKPKPAATNDQS